MVQVFESFSHAFEGIVHAVRTETNIRIQLAALAAVLGAAAWCRVTPVELALLLLSSGCVIALELVNTALETVVNLVTEEYSERAKLAKDVAAGAVLVMAGVSVLVGLAIVLPRAARGLGF